MTIKRVSAMLAASSVLALTLSGFAYADDVSLNQTGPDSTNTVTITHDNNATVTNTNHVTVTNNTNQTATSGSAEVSHNTTGGDATSGDANNMANTTTSVSIDNSGSASGCGCGQGGAGDPGNHGGGGGGGSHITGAGGGAGNVGTASFSGTGSGLLPKTGPNDSVDVSAMRNSVLGVNAPTPELVKKTNNLSTGLLIAAALLSLIGAVGSALYASKKEKVA